MSLDFPYEKVKEYISEKKELGENITLMSCVLAAYVRTVAEFPELNRFVISKKIYARKGIFFSFIILKEKWDGESERDETVVKLEFTGYETITEVSEMISEVINENKKEESQNIADKLLAAIFRVPVIPGAIISFLKFMDKIGILPKSVIKASPFHTSVFFTNMASIRSYPVYHHLYDFGSTSTFIALGVDLTDKGKYLLKINADERICNGSTYVRALRHFLKYIRKPTLLETAPDKVKQDMR